MSMIMSSCVMSCVPAPSPRGSGNASSPSLLHHFTPKYHGDRWWRWRQTVAATAKSDSSSTWQVQQHDKVKEAIQLLLRDHDVRRRRDHHQTDQIHQTQGGCSSTSNTSTNGDWELENAYGRCIELASKDFSTNFILTPSSHPLFVSGASFVVRTVPQFLWKPEQIRSFAALAVWCRRTDELVDGINAGCTTPKVLDEWEQRLIDLLQSGQPCDIYDAALFDTIQKYPIHMQVFKDMIEGMRIDLEKTRYENFEELFLYCYHVGGTVGLIIVQLLMAMDDDDDADSRQSLESVYNAALTFGIAAQLTDILRDIQEDARIGRIYLPQDELANAGLSDKDIYNGKINYRWQNFMKGQIKRIRMYLDEGEKLMDKFKNSDAKGLFWLIMLTNRQILDEIEANDYSFSKQASVGILKQLAIFIIACGISLRSSSSIFVRLAKAFFLFRP